MNKENFHFAKDVEEGGGGEGWEGEEEERETDEESGCFPLLEPKGWRQTRQ